MRPALSQVGFVMFDDGEISRWIGSAFGGLIRGFALSLGVMIVMDVAAIGDATGWLRVGLPHPDLMICLIMTLVVLAGLLELEHDQHRLKLKTGAQAAR